MRRNVEDNIRTYLDGQQVRRSTKLFRKPSAKHVKILDQVVKDIMLSLDFTTDNILQTINAVVYALAIGYKQKYDIKLTKSNVRSLPVIEKIKKLQKKRRYLKSILMKIRHGPNQNHFTIKSGSSKWRKN